MIHSPDAGAIAAIVGDRLVSRSDDELVIESAEPAELNASLVGQGFRIGELTVQRRTLEQTVLELTEPGSDRVDR